MRIGHQVRKVAATLLVTTLVAAAGFMLMPGTASAHCDSANGPVVTAAKKSLETGEVKWALAYVKADAEAEVTAAFNHAMAVRQLGGEAQKLADQYFAETTLRLHRVGEGASYDGIQENPVITPGLEAAEMALDHESTDEVYAMLSDLVMKGLEEHYQKVLHARELADREGTVEALREKAEAELLFEKYVVGVEQAALGLGEHNHGTATDGHGAKANGPIAIHVKGTALPVGGVTVGGEMMVPLRAVAEAFGFEVAWDGATSTATVTKGAQVLTVQLANKHARVNGKEISLPAAPVMHDARIMVPGHLMAEFLGVEINWNAEHGVLEFVAH